MTRLKKSLSRRTNAALDGSYGKDRNRRLVVTMIPGTDEVQDLLEIRPEGTRRRETIAICDIYRLAVRVRVNRENLEKAREKKTRKQALREQRALDRAARKLKKPI